MAPVCAACNQPISSARPGKARQRRMVALLSLPDTFATNQPRQRVAQLWRVVAAWLRR